MIQTEMDPTSKARSSLITYGSGSLELNLALRPRAVGPSLELAGALVDRESGGLRDVPAYLLRGSRILDEAQTDEKGVFHLRTGLKEGLRICLLLNDDRMVELELGHRRSGRQEELGRPTHRPVLVGPRRRTPAQNSKSPGSFPGMTGTKLRNPRRG